MTDQLRFALLELHKMLVDEAKNSYETIHGPIAGPAALFKLLVDEPSFQWLRALSETIVAIDEALEKNPPASHSAIVEMVKLRLFPAETTEFSNTLEEVSQKSQRIKEMLEATKKML